MKRFGDEVYRIMTKIKYTKYNSRTFLDKYGQDKVNPFEEDVNCAVAELCELLAKNGYSLEDFNKILGKMLRLGATVDSLTTDFHCLILHPRFSEVIIYLNDIEEKAKGASPSSGS